MLLGKLDFSELLSASHHMLILDTHDRSGRRLDGSSVLDVLGSEVLLEGGEVLEVILVDISEGNTGGGLAVNKLSEGGLVLDNTVRNILGSAETRQEGAKLDGLNIVGNDDELGLAFLNKGGNMVQTELEDNRLGADVLSLVSSLSGFSLRLKSGLLVSSGLRLISVEELEELSRLVLVKGVGEDVQRSGHLESHHEDGLLSLDSNVLGPLDESGEVSDGLDITTNSEVLGSLLEKGVSRLGGFAGGDDLLGLSGFGRHVFN